MRPKILTQPYIIANHVLFRPTIADLEIKPESSLITTPCRPPPSNRVCIHNHPCLTHVFVEICLDKSQILEPEGMNSAHRTTLRPRRAGRKEPEAGAAKCYFVQQGHIVLQFLEPFFQGNMGFVACYKASLSEFTYATGSYKRSAKSPQPGWRI
jgi:hypothetical protein